MARDIYLPITIDDIDIPADRREVNAAAVKRLADSIDKVGLRHPITVREKGDRYILVAGRHRIEAYRKMGIEHIPATIVKMTNSEARKWEIAENLHRAELTKLERDENIAEWIRICEEDQVVSGKLRETREGRPGIPSSVKEELGVNDDDAKRAVRVASLSEEAKDAARDQHLDNNRSALLEAARETGPQAQVAKITKIADLAKHRASKVDGDVKQRAAREVADIIAEYVPGDAWDAIKANLYAAGAANIANELTNITGQSIMEGRYK